MSNPVNMTPLGQSPDEEKAKAEKAARAREQFGESFKELIDDHLVNNLGGFKTSRVVSLTLGFEDDTNTTSNMMGLLTINPPLEEGVLSACWSYLQEFSTYLALLKGGSPPQSTKTLENMKTSTDKVQ